MNKVVLIGRMTDEPKMYETQGNSPMKMAKYTLAVNRRFRREGQQNTDFIGCVAYGKQAEFIEKYFHKGSKIAIAGRIQTGSYTKKDGTKVYTTDVIVEEQDFAESKSTGQQTQQQAQPQQQPAPQPQQQTQQPWMNMPDDYGVTFV